MNLKYKLLTIKTLLIWNFLFGFSSSNPDQTFSDNIKSVQITLVGDELAAPILSLNSNNQLIVRFDLLEEEQNRLAYRLIHYNSDWTPSAVRVNDYLSNFRNEFYLNDYEYSFNTLVPYTHFSLLLPNDDVSFKLSGNYAIEVFPEDNPENILFRKRFMVVNRQVQVEGEIRHNNQKQYFDKEQRVDFVVNYPNFNMENPAANVKAVISQNFNWSRTTPVLKPLFLRNQQLDFTYRNRLTTFPGSSEYDFFDIRSLTYESRNVRKIEENEDQTHVLLRPKKAFHNTSYFYFKDLNGQFYIDAENRSNPMTEADYSWVTFSLIGEAQNGKVYATGNFVNGELTEQNRMQYSPADSLYYTHILLKQGQYDYAFILQKPDGVLVNMLGDFSETENDYYVFVYYYDNRLRGERLIGWTRINSVNTNPF